jgi:ribosomal protein S18 acetylase RimI-like enzyme
MKIELRPFTAADLPNVERWFDDAETRRRLGDRAWPRHLLELVAPPDRVAFVACADGRPVALVDVEHAERTAFAVVVDPGARQRGIATRMLAELMNGELAGRQVLAGVERGNIPPVRLLERAGFRLVGHDDDGFDYYVHP